MSILQILLFLRDIQGQSTRGRKTRVVAQHHISMGNSLAPGTEDQLSFSTSWSSCWLERLGSPEHRLTFPDASALCIWRVSNTTSLAQQSPTHPFSWVARRKLQQAVMPALDNDACSSHLNPLIKSHGIVRWGFHPHVTDICQMWMVVICHLTGTWVYTVLPRSTTEMHWASLMNAGPWSGTELGPHLRLALSELQCSVSIGSRVGIKHKSNGKWVKEKQMAQ
jgi:hypothetical protein